MFGPEFYPTPEKLIRKMLKPYYVSDYEVFDFRGMKILEPSAGSGAILSFIKKVDHISDARFQPERLHAIELNPDLRNTLIGGGHQVIHDDFLTFHTDTSYDLIVMNPPFSNGDAHLLKAWDVMKVGEIICILNAETIRNPHTKQRKHLVKLIEEHGEVTFHTDEFKDAARKTKVEVALVRMRKVTQDKAEFEWIDEAHFEREQDYTFTSEVAGNAPARFDLIDSMVQRYGASKKAFVDFLKSRQRLMSYVDPLTRKNAESMIDEALKGHQFTDADVKLSRVIADFNQALQVESWYGIIDRTKLRELMTESVRKKFDKMIQDQGGMAFTQANINALIEMLFLNRSEILHQSVVDSFDLMTRYHSTNTSHWEGWKSNHAFKVNRKVIIPSMGVKYCTIMDRFEMNYHRRNELQDIDRACAMLVGKRLDSPTGMKHRVDKEGQPFNLYTIDDALTDRFRELGSLRGYYMRDVDNTAESEFFYMKFWKKGTLHLVFKDEDLWQRFNIEAARGKKWLPNDPDHMPTPKTTPSERTYVRSLEKLAAYNRQQRLEAAAK